MKVFATTKVKEKPVHTNCWGVAIKYMYGDADGYETIHSYIPRNERNDAEMPRFVKFLENCKNAYLQGCEREHYYAIKDYDRYVEDSRSATDDLDYHFIICWCYDVYGDYPAAFVEYEITHFGNNGTEFIVEVENESIPNYN